MSYPSRYERSPSPRQPIQKDAAQGGSMQSRRGLKIAVTIASVLVLALTGFSWAKTTQNVSTSDVIENATTDFADGARDVLLVGLDSRTDAHGNPLSKELLAQLHAGTSDGELNTDTLILVRIPNDGSKAVAVSFPRDSYVDIPGGYGKHKVNSAYARAKTSKAKELQQDGIKDPKELELKSNQEGAITLIKTIETLTKIKIDNYAAINLLGFSEITKSVGGVDVCLKANTKDSYSGADFKAGQQNISGANALAFVRQRHGLPNGDLDRVVRQQVFMASLANKVLSAGTLSNPAKLNGLVDAIKNAVVLNHGWDILSFAQQLKNLTGGQLQFQTIPVANMEYSTPEDGSAIQIEPKQVQKFVQEAINPPPAAQPSTTGPNNAATTVDVHNASGETGLAATISGDLVNKGFTAGAVANASPRKTTVVRFPPGSQGAADAVVKALGKKATVEQDHSVSAGHISVLLGSDFSNTSVANSASSSASAKPSSSNNANATEEKTITADGMTCVN